MGLISVLTAKVNIKQYLSPVVLVALALLLSFGMVASPSTGLFVAIVLGLTVLLMMSSREIFILFLGGSILFYIPFLQGYVFSVGNAKVYIGDLVIASLFIFLLLRFLFKGFAELFAQRSTRLFLLFFILGIVAVIRGIPSYGYSAIGEARWYVLPMIYYFFVITMFKDKQRIKSLVKWVIGFIVIMVFFRFFEFFFFGGNEGLTGQSAFRFINAAQALVVAFVFISLFLFYISGRISGRNLLYSLTLGILFLIIIVVQHRSVWIATAGGLIAVHLVLRKVSIRAVAVVAMGLLLLAFSARFLGNFIGEDVYTTLERSAIFLQDPQKDYTGSWRIIGWQQRLETAMKHPIVGEGLGGYSKWFYGHTLQRLAVHNGYIMHFSKFGIIGLLLLFTGLAFWYIEMHRYVRMESDRYYKLLSFAIQICVFMHLIYAFFFDFTIFFWVLLAAGSVVTRAYDSSYLSSVCNKEGLSK